MTVIYVAAADDLQGLSTISGVNPLNAADFAAHGPDLHLALVKGRELSARCSLWWSSSPAIPGERIGCIGHYEALNGGSAMTLINAACSQLATQGCTLAVGPLDGNTWRRYRFITQRGSEPPFFLEPDNPDDYPRYFEQAGFTPFSRYYSSVSPEVGADVSLPAALEARLGREGVEFRPFRLQRFDDELETLYDLSVAGFRNNLLYTDISRAEFLGTYAKVRALVRPELVLFAEQGGKPAGFIFALPDLLRQQRGEESDTVILKSMAVLPEWSGMGIGAALMAMVSANARELGFKRAIHALMHEENRSRRMSGHYGREIRQYTLYSRRLA